MKGSVLLVQALGIGTSFWPSFLHSHLASKRPCPLFDESPVPANFPFHTPFTLDTIFAST